jgi:hypothetical protein
MSAATTQPVTITAERPPYLAALAVSLLVLVGYVVTLGPTVTFWDAGEFIATSKILGIPHPPGTPLFVLLDHVWSWLIPLGAYAYRSNLMTAMFSAAGAGFFFLLMAQALRARPAGEKPDRVFEIGGAAAAAVISAFVFTVWQNSNETEVYMVATLSISAVCWLTWLWRRHRGTGRAPHILLLVVYILAVSLGAHLLTLLVGPAVIGFMYHTIRTEPLRDEQERRVERAQLAVLTGIWALLVGTGMGSTALLILGGVIFLLGAVYAAATGAALFAASVFLLAAVGASTYLFLYVRAGLNPFINEADPSTWNSLLAVIRREQYPPRSPLDNPIYPSGPDNPGRNLALLWLQIQNYLQYFDWQWANGLATARTFFAWPRLPFTILFTSLGIYGMQLVKQRDGGMFWLLLLLWLTTGFVLMIYINFKPGFSLAYDQFPDINQHEVRERDYFYTVSYQVWGLFAGVGIAGLYQILKRDFKVPGAAAGAVLGLGLLPFALNYTAASRSYGKDARLARDFAYDLLQSVEPYGILFTNGDNDTFPLWYLQEVEGIRQDVSVVNLSLGNTDWYIRQLRDNPVRPFLPAQAPWYAGIAPAKAPPPLHSLTDREIASLQPQLLSRTLRFVAGRVDHTYPENTPFYVKDILILRLVQENVGRRPIYFSLTAGNNWLGMQWYLTEQGLALKLHADAPPDTSRLASGLPGLPPVDVPRTDSLVWHVYRYADLARADTLELEPTSRNITTNLSIPPLALGQAFQQRGDLKRSVQNLEWANHLNPSTDIAQIIRMLRSRDTSLFRDTAKGRR